LQVNGIISGAGGVGTSFSDSTGTVVLAGSNTNTGNTVIAKGILSASTLNSVGTGHAASSNLGAPTTTANGTIGFGTTTFAGQLAYTGSGETTDRVIDLRGTTGGATINQAGAGALKFTSDLTATGNGTKTLTLTGSTGGTGELAGVIVDSAAGATSLTKSGAGTWTLSGANTYTGNTTVTAGTLILADNSQTSFGIGASGTNNQVLGGGTLMLNGDFAFNLTGAGTGLGNSWDIVHKATLSATFGATFTVLGFTDNLDDTWSKLNGGTTYTFSEGTGILSVTAIPEPAVWALLAFSLTTVMVLRRRRA
jgi:autotransporter-associated beta strand protein